jgi:spore maturation protein CgeB
MRPDQSRIVTGRTFEAILAGALLAQEANPDMDYYFVSGEHYLSFSTFPELRAIARFIAEHPDDAEHIRRTGNAYGKATYNDDKLIGHLDRRLFFLG